MCGAGSHRRMALSFKDRVMNTRNMNPRAHDQQARRSHRVLPVSIAIGSCDRTV